jgi:replicative DNA helicase
MTVVAFSASDVPEPPDAAVPQADDAEKAVLGAVLLQKDGFRTAQDCLGRDFFRLPRHRYVWDAYEAVAARGEPTDDILIVRSQLIRSGTLVEAGGESALSRLVDGLPRSTNIPHYAKIVRDKAKLRDIRLWAWGVYNTAATEQALADVVLADAERHVRELATDGPTDALLSGEQLSSPMLIRVQTALANGGKLTGISTGFYEIDEATTGLQPGQLIVIAGRPSMGKTSWASAAAWHISTHGGVVFFASIEMRTEDVALRLACLEARVDYKSAVRGLINQTELNRIIAASAKLENSGMHIGDEVLTVQDVRRLSRVVKARTGRLDLVVVDYLTMLRPPMGSKRIENRSREVGDYSRELKGLAKELDVPVLVIAQLNRSPDGRQDKRPILSDLRDSGEIEQDADLVAFLYLAEKYDKSANPHIGEFIIAKQRNGPTGPIELSWDGPTMRYGNLDRRS